MTNHALRIRLATGLLVCAAVALPTVAATNSFDWAMQLALGQWKLDVPNDSLRACMGVAFAPVLSTTSVCFSRGQQLARTRLLGNLGHGFGVVCNPLALKPGAWNNVLVRAYLRDLMRGSIAGGEAVIVEGAWHPSTALRQWGVARSMNAEHVIRGSIQAGPAELALAPETVLIVGVTNVSQAPGAFLAATLASAARLAAGVPSRLPGDASIVSGVAAVDLVADAAHRRPWCTECGEASAVCITLFLRTWRDDVAGGVRHLRTLMPQFSGDTAVAAKEALAGLEELNGMLNAVADEAVVWRNCRDEQLQAAFGERIRGLGARLGALSASLARAAGQPQPQLPGEPSLQAGMPGSREVAPWLPPYSAIQDGDRPFLCSALIATRFAGVLRQPAWAKAVYRNPFTVAIPSSLQAAVPDVADELESGRALFSACGVAPTAYTWSTTDPARIELFIRRAIVESICRGIPVLEYGAGGSNVWGVIAAYANYGAVLGCRTPMDTTTTFRIVSELPGRVMVIGKASDVRGDHETLVRLLRAALAADAVTNGPVLSGTTALSFWQQRLKECAESDAIPGADLARWNERIWAALVDRKREAYVFLEAAAKSQPAASVELISLRNTYVAQVNELQPAAADGIVLRERFGGPYPADWKTKSAVRQLKVMDRVITLERDARNQAQAALTRLEHEFTPLSTEAARLMTKATQQGARVTTEAATNIPPQSVENHEARLNLIKKIRAEQDQAEEGERTKLEKVARPAAPAKTTTTAPVVPATVTITAAAAATNAPVIPVKATTNAAPAKPLLFRQHRPAGD